MGCSRQSLMTLASVNTINVCELVFVSDMDVLALLSLSDYLSGRWAEISISYKYYCHLLTVLKSFVA